MRLFRSESVVAEAYRTDFAADPDPGEHTYYKVDFEPSYFSCMADDDDIVDKPGVRPLVGGRPLFTRPEAHHDKLATLRRI
jgi:hypothetical protein